MVCEGHPQLPFNEACDFFLLKKSFTILSPLSQGLWDLVEAAGFQALDILRDVQIVGEETVSQG